MASLTPKKSVLGKKNARHLLRRSTFVYSKELIDKFAKLTPKQALDLLFEDPKLEVERPIDINLKYENRDWINSTDENILFHVSREKYIYIAGWFWYNAVKSPTLKYKLAFFLSTRFTVSKSANPGPPTMFYDHIRLLLYFAYGNYKTLAKKMTLDNSMLRYLNNEKNEKNAPNENYAREFFELFTIGKGEQRDKGDYTTYKEHDIVQAAKVLTGFKYDRSRTIIDNDTKLPKGNNSVLYHDTNSKIFSSCFNNKEIKGGINGESMDDELNEFVEMVFSKPDTAKNICRKIYTFFVKGNITPEVEQGIITPLAAEFELKVESNIGYELKPIIRKLLESEHFYDSEIDNKKDEIIGAMIKSPLQQISEIFTYFQMELPDLTTPDGQVIFYQKFWGNFIHNNYMSKSNMKLFEPDDVAGHQAYYKAPNMDKNWISSSTLIARYKLGESLLEGKNKLGNSDIGVKIDVMNVIKKIVSNPSDPTILCTELMNDLFAQEPSKLRINHFKENYLLGGAKLSDKAWEMEWKSYVQTNDKTKIEPRIIELLKHILKAVETQMM